MDSRCQLANGDWVRSIAPTALRSDVSQKPSANDSTTASVATVRHGTA